MTKSDGKTASAAVKEILLSNPDGPREVMQEVLEAELDEALGAAKSERTPDRLGSQAARRTNENGPPEIISDGPRADRTSHHVRTEL